MNPIVLSGSTGSDSANRAIGELLTVLTDAAGDCIRSVYVEGSYADGTARETSDLDVTVVFAGRNHGDAARGRISDLVARIGRNLGVELDVDLLDETSIAAGVYPSLKWAGVCVFGADTRDEMRVMPIDAWTRERMHLAYWLLVHVFERRPGVRLPLPYPDPAGPFYGYDNRTVRLPDGQETASTRNLVRVSGWIATALLAYRAGVYVARKRDCHVAYRRHIGDEWSSLLEDIYRQCRTDWQYLIPQATHERRVLRQLCERTLQFENHFLAIYRLYLWDQLRSDEGEARQRALWVLERTPYCDDAVRNAVSHLASSGEDTVRGEAMRALATLDQAMDRR